MVLKSNIAFPSFKNDTRILVPNHIPPISTELFKFTLVLWFKG